ncbi:MAG: hypothetical protein B6242_02445 [Anaerolineaceae bacterium 4572_78]|nr:MAG: hypothetical protein B6242_02445 [Anaerolineaceae bacterium 4572_78]
MVWLMMIIQPFGEVITMVREQLLKVQCLESLKHGKKDLGNYVIIRHDDLPNREGYQGTTFSAYTHLYTVTDGLEAGGKVLRGTIIGEQGSTGNSSGTHLHFQIDKDRSIRPFNHPYWLGDPDSGDTPLVAQYTYNPMRLIEAHSVETEFDYNLHTEYYSNQNLTEPSSEEYYSETEIDFEWFDSSPIPYGTPAPFSVRWEGRTPFLRQGGWIFYVTTGDGIRLQINNELVIDEWHTQDVGVNTYEYHWLLSSRQRPIVEMEYFDVNNPAVAQLAWQRVPDVYLPIIMKSILLIPTPDPYPFHRK